MFATDILPIEVWRLIIARLSNPRDLLSMALCQREDWSEYALERLHSQVRFHSIQQRDGFFSALLNVVETVSPKLDSLSSLVSKNVQEEEEEEEEAAVINTNSLPQQMMLLDNNLLASLSLHAHPSSHPSSQRRQTQQLPSLEWISSSNWSSQVFDQEEVVSPYFPRSATLQNMPKITAADSLVSSAAITRCNSIENINNFSSKTKMLHNILLVRSLDFGLDVFGPNIDSSTKSGDDQINSSFTLMHGASGMQLANDHAEEEEDEIFPLSRSSVYQPGPLRSLSSSVYDLTTIASINQAEVMHYQEGRVNQKQKFLTDFIRKLIKLLKTGL